MESILTSIKKMLGIDSDYTQFDSDLILLINSMLMMLNQLGIGPSAGFSIVDETATWTDFIGAATDLEAVKLYVALKVRISFDPPASAFVLEAMERTLTELTWRLSVQANVTE